MTVVKFQPYEIPLTSGQKRSGILVKLGGRAWGDITPLPKWSKETYEEALKELQENQDAITSLEHLERLNLFPSVHFGLESSFLEPLPEFSVPVSALLMGTSEEILAQAALRYSEGYRSAKLKVSNLSFEEAASIINQLKDTFFLRIDVNRAWSNEESLKFFAQFPKDAFDYVEEPFQNPHDLKLFTHPLAVDESFPQDLTLEELEDLPTLKSLIYKPTIQGGLSRCLPICEWAEKRGISIVLSSSFESDVGLAHIASMAKRLSIKEPIGIGTYHFLGQFLRDPPLEFSRGRVTVLFKKHLF